MLQHKPLLNVEQIRKDFPILQRRVHGKPLVYLDNAATSQKPKQVIDAINFYYKNYNANVHRSIHLLGEEATAKLEEAHQKIADFINAGSYQSIVLTKNATESLNLAAYSLTLNLKKGDEIVLSQMEHHSNLVPWQQLAKQRGLVLKFIKINKNGALDEESIKSTIRKKTEIVSVTHVSNVLGTINDIKKISKITHENDALMAVDGAQSAPHMPVDVQALDVDFYAFSGHKAFGPTGVGILFGKKEILDALPPYQGGGDMIQTVTIASSPYQMPPLRFEAGTPPIAEVIALGEALLYIEQLGREKIAVWERDLLTY